MNRVRLTPSSPFALMHSYTSGLALDPRVSALRTHFKVSSDGELERILLEELHQKVDLLPPESQPDLASLTQRDLIHLWCQYTDHPEVVAQIHAPRAPPRISKETAELCSEIDKLLADDDEDVASEEKLIQEFAQVHVDTPAPATAAPAHSVLSRVGHDLTWSDLLSFESLLETVRYVQTQYTQ